MGFFLKFNDAFCKLGNFKKNRSHVQSVYQERHRKNFVCFCNCCLQAFTFLVYYKDLRFYLFLYLDKIVLRLCLIFCLILQFLAKYLGNLNKLFLSKIIFVQRLSLLIFSCYHSNSACVPHQANLNNLQNTIVKITLYLTYLDTAMKLQPSQKVSN